MSLNFDLNLVSSPTTSYNRTVRDQQDPIRIVSSIFSQFRPMSDDSDCISTPARSLISDSTVQYEDIDAFDAKEIDDFVESSSKSEKKSQKSGKSGSSQANMTTVLVGLNKEEPVDELHIDVDSSQISAEFEALKSEFETTLAAKVMSLEREFDRQLQSHVDHSLKMQKEQTDAFNVFRASFETNLKVLMAEFLLAEADDRKAETKELRAENKELRGMVKDLSHRVASLERKRVRDRKAKAKEMAAKQMNGNTENHFLHSIPPTGPSSPKMMIVPNSSGSE
ncbi:hypothetical protein DICA3_A03136 [Diutina catenulata]